MKKPVAVLLALSPLLACRPQAPQPIVIVVHAPPGTEVTVVGAEPVEVEEPSESVEPVEPVEITELTEIEPLPEPPAGPAPTDEEVRRAVDRALGWLAAQQDEDGAWRDGEEPGGRVVGLTALALLAFQEEGHSILEGRYEENVAHAVHWLRKQQDPDSGRIGPAVGHDYMYGHGIATLALCEAYRSSRNPLIERTAQDAVSYVLRARNPYAAWRYDMPPIGDNDTSITGWMLAALDSAREVGLLVDEAAFEGGLDWLDEVTDPATGRVGYDSFGSLSSRTPANEHFPREKGEAMTAVGLSTRFRLEEVRTRSAPVTRKSAGLLLRKLPIWDPEGLGVDMYYWYHGTRAMKGMGGEHWEAWRRAMLHALVGSQEDDGSWEPVGPWAVHGGRVYATVLMTLCLSATGTG